MRPCSSTSGSVEAISRIFSPAGHVAQMLRFEAALARAHARAGLMTSEVAEQIASRCDVSLVNVDAIMRDAESSGTPVIPLVRQLTAQVPPSARDWVHLGATSQDVIDTALVMQMRDGLEVLIAETCGVGDAAATLSERHRASVMPGRTLMQHAVPVTFGLKAARWLSAVTRQRHELERVRRELLVLQFGGAAGTLAALGTHGRAVAGYLAEELELPLPDLPWHAERDRPAGVVAALGILAGTMAKVATDLVLLAQTEVGEVAEGAARGKGASSAMPHKRNPVDAMQALVAARLAIGMVPVVLGAMAQEHERAAGSWQAEWQAIPEAFRQSARATHHVRLALETLEVNTERMRENLSLDGARLMAESVVTALRPSLGALEAKRVVGELSAGAARSGQGLGDAARADARVSAVLDQAALEAALDPARSLGGNDEMIDAALRAWRDARGTPP
ncbi:MAG: adenylosuccinate lyase family protein [Cytophagaceae bacterium]|nr:adenylosuccinate lyase family protein [Gemmatimonadaceae bacterium]